MYVHSNAQEVLRLVFGRRREQDGADVSGLSSDALAALVGAARAVNESGDLESTLATILREAIGLLEAHDGSVMLFDEDREALRIRASSGLPPEVVSGTRVPLGDGIAGYVASSGTPLVIGEDEADRDSRSPDDQRSGLRSAISVPLKTRGAVEGVLNVSLRKGRGGRSDFSDDDLNVAELFGEFAAAAVHNAQLYAAARVRGDEMAVLFEASHALSGALEVDEVSEGILEAAGELIGGVAGFVCALPDDRPGPEVTLYRDIARGRVMACLRREGFADLLRTTSVRLVSDLENDNALASLAEGPDRAAVIAPLIAGGTTRGLLVSIVTAPGPSDAQLRLLTTYTNHAALALGKALLFRSVRTKEDELTSLASSVPDPVVIADSSGRLHAINPAAAEIFALNPQFEIGQSLAGKLRSQELEDLLLADEPGRLEVTLFTPSPQTYRARATPVRPGHGPSGARILTLEDITAEKEMEQVKADFVAVIGHELRTPLTLIKGYAGTLAKRGDKLRAEARSKALDNIHMQAQRLERLIEDLLLVSRVERHRPPLHLEKTDLADLLTATIERARIEHQGREIELTAELDDATMLVDVTKLEQVMHHLLDNAVKFSDAAGVVRVEAEEDDGWMEVRVIDEGQGIFSGDLPNLFKRFHQVDGTATRAHGGTGIGLYICKTLVEAHGGRIGVKSALGKGSAFWFRLPTEPLDQDDDSVPAEPA